KASQSAAIIQSREKFAIMNVKDFGGNAEDFGGFLHFAGAALGKGATCVAPMTDITVGDRNEFDFVPFGSPHRCHPASLDLAVVRVGPEADNPDLTVGGLFRRFWGRERFGGSRGERRERGGQETEWKEEETRRLHGPGRYSD